MTVIVVVHVTKAFSVRDAVKEVEEALPQYRVESYVGYQTRLRRMRRTGERMRRTGEKKKDEEN